MTVSVPVDPSKTVNALERRYREWRSTRVGREVYQLFYSFAMERARAGRRFGVKALAERVRWEVALAHPTKADDLKINNSHIAYLARDLARENPRLREFIEFRRVREED